jgi:hypothetical protein
MRDENCRSRFQGRSLHQRQGDVSSESSLAASSQAQVLAAVKSLFTLLTESDISPSTSARPCSSRKQRTLSLERILSECLPMICPPAIAEIDESGPLGCRISQVGFAAGSLQRPESHHFVENAAQDSCNR